MTKKPEVPVSHWWFAGGVFMFFFGFFTGGATATLMPWIKSDSAPEKMVVETDDIYKRGCTYDWTTLYEDLPSVKVNGEWVGRPGWTVTRMCKEDYTFYDYIELLKTRGVGLEKLR